ncbi:MAG TPA: phosphoserine phosphatase [Labilithrix sp.]|nr:phosphoserine phosphatase [Labilithrix sp.]
MSSGIKRSLRPAQPEQATVWAAKGTGLLKVSAAWISRPREGESVCGDAVVVREQGAGVLLALIDALGHGPKAAEVADVSTHWLASAPPDDGAPGIIQGLHRALHGSRGAAGLIVVVSPKGIEACSVGNVELRSTTNKLPFVLTPGVLGVRLRQPRTSFAAAPIAERFVLFSDGISGRFDLRGLRDRSTSDAATYIFANHRHAHDDATVIVVDVA